MREYYIIFFLLLAVNIYGQGIRYNEEFQVNTYTDSDQFLESIIALPNGNFFICWGSRGQEGASFSIRAQIFNSDGCKIGEEFRISNIFYSHQKYPDIALLPNGRIVITWQAKSSFFEDWEIFATIIDPERKEIWKEYRVNTLQGDELECPKLCVLENKYVVIWKRGYYEIRAQMFDLDGNRIDEEFKVNSISIPSFNYYEVTTLDEEKFVVCWEGYTDEIHTSDIFAQICNSKGTVLNEEFLVNTYLNNSQNRPSIHTLSDGKFIISWISYEQDGDYYGIYAQMFNSDGTKFENEFRVNSSPEDSQTNQHIFLLQEDKFIICWLSNDVDYLYNYYIYAQIFNLDGKKVGGEFQINTSANTWAGNVDLCVLSNSNYLACWHSREEYGSDWGVFGQVFDLNGMKIGNEFQINSFVNYEQSNQRVCSLKNNKFLVSWNSDEQDGSGLGVFGKYFLDDVIRHSLDEFALVSPENDATIQQANPVFTWNKASGTRINYPWELTYDLFIDKDELFSDPLIITGIQDTTYQIDSLEVVETYFAKVLARTYYGDSLWCSNVNGFYIHRNATDLEDSPESLPIDYELAQNYPNPFNPETNIEFTIPSSSSNVFVEIKVYNFLGQLVKILISESLPSGTHSVKWNGKNEAGRQMPSGIYFYTISARNYTNTKKMILLR